MLTLDRDIVTLGYDKITRGRGIVSSRNEIITR